MNDEVYMQRAAAVRGHGGLNRIVECAASIDSSP
jgi:hypothetical protein